MANPFLSAQPYLVGVGMPIIVGMLSFAVPALYSQGASIARLDVKSDQMKADLDKLTTQVDKVNEHLTQGESDPSKLLAKIIGGQPGDMNIATFAYVDGKLYALPKNDKAKSRFIAAGFGLSAITPTISGFVLDARAAPDIGRP